MRIYLADTDCVHAARITALGTLQNRVLLSAAEDGVIVARPFDRSAEDVRMSEHSGAVLALASFRDSHFMVSAGADGRLMIWNTDTGEYVRTLLGHEGAVTAVALANEGRVIVSGGEDGTLRFWDTLTGELCRVVDSGMGPVMALIALGSAAKRVLARGRDADAAAQPFAVWESDGQLVRRFEDGRTGITSITLLTDGRLLTGDVDGSLTEWELESGRVVRTAQVDGGGAVWAIAPNERYVVVEAASSALNVWDLAQAQIVHTLDVPAQNATQIMVTPDSRRIVVGNVSGTVSIYRVTSS